MAEAEKPHPTAGEDGNPSQAFVDDPHISFDKESGKWRYETDDGQEFEYDMTARAWVPLVDEELVRAQQAAYAVPGVDEEAPAAPVLKRTKKRKEMDYTSNSGPSGTQTSIKRGKTNTKGDYAGLPPDTTREELEARFKVCGVLMLDKDNEQSNIKMYADDGGAFTGEALVVYFKEESVDLAIRMLDEAEFRVGEAGTVMRVKRGEFTHKEGGAGGEAGAPPPRRVVDKKKATARIAKLNRQVSHGCVDKLADWDSSDEDDAEKSRSATTRTRSVLLKHMFTLEQLDEDASLLLDLKEEVREECETLGEVTNVVLYDKEPEGIMMIKFKEPLSAQACVIKMNGRFFDGRRVVATLFDGKVKFKRSGVGDAEGGELDEGADEAEKKRLDAFAEWLEEGGGK
ncbi:hypothetical protein BS47DRAFT_1442731 [Hydnum rufescens UP504]|uniref:RRM domain-containing protein n=1 Tax=Hydnum rufescens UP504 TaxID=1448309 RepID=A0A9P6B3C3_9AGAM|nr:hypothetical protein BS47DRAFT_1442731 [Hydnum rufescens UP504]